MTKPRPSGSKKSLSVSRARAGRRLTRNTTGNSRPLAAWTVSSDTASAAADSSAASPTGRPAEISRLLEQPVQDVRDGERIAKAADAIGEVDQGNRPLRDLRLHLREPFGSRRLEAIAQAHAVAAESPGSHSIQAAVRQSHDRSLQHPHERSVVHRVLGEAEHRQYVLDLLAVEEARATARQIRDALAP